MWQQEEDTLLIWWVPIMTIKLIWEHWHALTGSRDTYLEMQRTLMRQSKSAERACIKQEQINMIMISVCVSRYSTAKDCQKLSYLHVYAFWLIYEALLTALEDRDKVLWLQKQVLVLIKDLLPRVNIRDGWRSMVHCQKAKEERRNKNF